MAEEKTSGERYWIFIVRVIALILGFLPFIPNTLWYIGMNDTKSPIDSSDIFFVLFGFIMLWGSSNFGKWANMLGMWSVNKLKK